MHASALALISLLLCTAAAEINWKYSWNSNWAHDCYFSGNDISWSHISVSLCPLACAQTAGCTHYVWSNFGGDEGGKCWMKGSPVLTTDAIPALTKPRIECGIMRNPKPADGWVDTSWHSVWKKECDFYGNDIKPVHTSADACGSMCYWEDDCTHYAWSEHEGGKCWLKSAPHVTKAHAHTTNYNPSTNICGIVYPKVDGIPNPIV